MRAFGPVVLLVAACSIQGKHFESNDAAQADARLDGEDAQRDAMVDAMIDAPVDASDDARLVDARANDASLADARPADARPPDARPPDARPPDARPPDARPPDAMVDARGPYYCLGQPLPTTASDPIVFTGTTTDPVSNKILGNVSLAGNVIGQPPVSLGNSDASGSYMISLSSGGQPLNEYVRARLAGYLDTFAFPAVPLNHNTTVNIALMTSGDLSQVSSITGDTPDPTKGTLSVVVTDCDGTPVSGATVTTTSGGTIRYFAGGAPSKTATATDASGNVIIYNVPAGSTTVGAVVAGMTLRSHSFPINANAWNQTAVQP